MKKSRFLKEVMDEIQNIKDKATKEEISNLDFDRLDIMHNLKCIYGQMTGSCHSERAREITPKEYPSVASSRNEESFTTLKKEDTFNKKAHKRFTALEVYITIKNANNKGVIAYLKGEITEQQLIL